MSVHIGEQRSASSQLRVSVACFRWNGEALETIVTPDLALPSAVPTTCEPLDATADRIITAISNTPAAYIEQLYTFGYVNGDERETVVTYLALFSPDVAGDIEWQSPFAKLNLPEQTSVALDYAVVRLRSKLEYTSIAIHLLPPTFTLAALQTAYESILGATLDKRNFRRRMTTSDMLTATGDKLREGPHRPAALYRFSGRADRSSYLTPHSAGNGWQETDS